MRILITGANGYLGQGITKKILDNENNVVAVDFKVDRVDNRAEKIPCDIFGIENPYEYFGKPSILVHLAWKNGFVHYSDSHIYDLPKHYEFIKKMAEAGIHKIAVMGSMHEIGFFEGCIKENTPCNPVTPYGISKNSLRELTEMLCKEYNIVFQWMRGYYIVGNSEHGSSVFSKIAQAASNGEKEFPFTMGLNQFDFIDYNEFCHQVVATVSQESINGIVNICTGRPEKLADRTERFIVENDYKIKLKYGSFPDRPYDSKAVWGDDSKIKKILDDQKSNIMKK